MELPASTCGCLAAAGGSGHSQVVRVLTRWLGGGRWSIWRASGVVFGANVIFAFLVLRARGGAGGARPMGDPLQLVFRHQIVAQLVRAARLARQVTLNGGAAAGALELQPERLYIKKINNKLTKNPIIS